jgi:hypothetical protein
MLKTVPIRYRSCINLCLEQRESKLRGESDGGVEGDCVRAISRKSADADQYESRQFLSPLAKHQTSPKSLTIETKGTVIAIILCTI